jgi:hypothetical protein
MCHCLLRLYDKAKHKFETKFTNKVLVNDVLQLIDGAVFAHMHPRKSQPLGCIKPCSQQYNAPY